MRFLDMKPFCLFLRVEGLTIVVLGGPVVKNFTVALIVLCLYLIDKQGRCFKNEREKDSALGSWTNAWSVLADCSFYHRT